ncbi:MAG: oligosaccharide flippase family protein [Chitinophagales bacterium]
MNNGSNARQSLGFSIASHYSVFSFQLISTIVISRLLTPEEIGVFAVAASIIILSKIVRDYGIANYIIRHQDISPEILKTCFTLLLAVGFALGGLTYSMAGIIGDFFQSAGVTKVLIILALNFFIMPFGANTYAYLKKTFCFHQIAIIDICSGAVGVLSAIFFAYMGEKYLSLAYSSVLSTLTGVIVSKFFKPSWFPNGIGLSGWKKVVRFSLPLGISGSLSQLAATVIGVLIGRFFGLFEVGIYSRAFSTYSLFDHAIVQAIRPVMLPALSRKLLNEGHICSVYTRTVEMLTGLAWPFYIWLWFNAESVVYCLYGDQWSESIQFVKVFCLAGMLNPFIAFYSALFTAFGDIKRVFRFELVANLSKIIFIYIACQFELVAVVYAFVFSVFIAMVIGILDYSQKLNVTAYGFFKVLKKSAVVSIACYLVFILSDPYLSNFDNLQRLLISLVVYFITWATSIFLSSHAIKKELLLLWKVNGGFSKF